MTVVVDLRPFADWFPEDAWPEASCPACHAGFVAPTPDAGNPLHSSITSAQSATSARMQKEDYSEPEWIRGFFHGVLTCTSPRCAEITVVIGEMKVVDAYYEDPVSGGVGHAV